MVNDLRKKAKKKKKMILKKIFLKLINHAVSGKNYVKCEKT